MRERDVAKVEENYKKLTMRGKPSGLFKFRPNGVYLLLGLFLHLLPSPLWKTVYGIFLGLAPSPYETSTVSLKKKEI